MRFLANGTSGTWFYTDDITVTDAWLRAHPDDVEVIPLCRIPPRQHSHEQHIEELRAALARMLHMHHMMLETTHYRENITDARCIREMHEAPLQALNILSRYPHKKDEV
ncbi:TPA: hypothetical protein KJG35_005232 [Escherichia coli]|nr:hypothetical protein [Escherichia coli]